MGWTSAGVAKVNVKDANSPSSSFTFDGIATSGTYTDPQNTYGGIQLILDIGGLSAVQAGITRTIKQEGT